MPKVIAIHRLQLNAGVDPAAFEKFVQTDVFPGLRIVFHVDKALSHEFTKIEWLSSDHLLLRPAPQTGSDPTYLWMIVAPVAESEVATDEGRRVVEDEAVSVAREFFELGSTEETIAAVKLRPFATSVSLETFIEAAARNRAE